RYTTLLFSFFFSSRRRHTRSKRDWSSTCALPIFLGLSGTTNGIMATEGFKKLEIRTGQKLADLSAEHEGKQVSFEDAKAAPVPEIGRASCREGGWQGGGGGAWREGGKQGGGVEAE